MAIKIASRKQKARNLQKWVAEKISLMLGIPHGKDELIESREMGQAGVDVKLIGEAKVRFPFSIECKAQETWSVPSFVRQAQENKEMDTNWLLVMKRSRERPVICMDADAFFMLMENMSFPITKKRQSLKRK